MAKLMVASRIRAHSPLRGLGLYGFDHPGAYAGAAA
jgi:hypothetical protein